MDRANQEGPRPSPAELHEWARAKAASLYAPTFFQCLADDGVVPGSEEEARRLLLLGDRALAAAEAAAPAKRAAAAASLLDRAEAMLGVAPADDDERVIGHYAKLAADSMPEDPDLLGALALLGWSS